MITCACTQRTYYSNREKKFKSWVPVNMNSVIGDPSGGEKDKDKENTTADESSHPIDLLAGICSVRQSCPSD
jgi:hypothetical protein